MIRKLKKECYKVYILLHERKYKNIKYMLKKPQTGGVKSMIVSFAGFSPDCARYNYINTLRGMNCYQLFLLDDHGFQRRGSYYLDTIDEDGITENVVRLIKCLSDKHKIDKLYMVGSSKGGTCALLFGSKLNAEAVIIGAPQYYIGDYLNIPEHRDLLKAMVGNITEKKISQLNSLVFDELKQGNRNMEIYLHYSKRENTYKTQIASLVKDLNKLGYANVHLDDDYSYLTHAEVAKYYPVFLRKICEELMGKG